MRGEGGREHPQVQTLLNWARRVEWQGRPIYPTWLLRIEGAEAAHVATIAGVPLRSALPLLWLTIPIAPWPGLYLVVKPRSAKIASDLAARLEHLRDAGYRAIVCESADVAAQEMRHYLARGRTTIIERGVLARPRGR